MPKAKQKQVKKICSKCLKKLPLGDFYKSVSSKDGLTYWCVACCHESRERRKLAGDVGKSHHKIVPGQRFFSPYQHLIKSGHYTKLDLINKTDDELLDLMWRLEDIL